jgi:GDP-L-fucose synthase
MRALVLGGTGFVGENLVNRLNQEEGYHVDSCSKSTGVDILDYESILNKIKQTKPDIIFNMASHGGSMMYVRDFAADVYSDNLQMCLNIYKAVLEVNPEIKVIQPFSNCSYPGDSSIQSEDMWLNGGVHNSVFSFGNSKRAIYYLSQCYYNQYGIKTVNLLLPNTYGPGDSCDPKKTHALNGMVIRMLKAKSNGDEEFVVWGTGSPVREWAYIDDFIEILVRAVEIDHMEYPVNIGQEKGYSIAASAKLIKKACGFEGDIVFDTNYADGDPVKILSKKKFEEMFNDFEFFDHEKGIKNTVLYYECKV